MTVEELIEELKQMPPTAALVFEFDQASSYDFVSVTYVLGEVFLRVEGEDDNEYPDERDGVEEAER